MPKVSFTANLKRFFPDLQARSYSGTTVAEVLQTLESEYPGIRNYIVDDQGRLRKHVNIFVHNSMVRDKKHLSDAVHENDEIHILQALSGG